jgi:hypothetical protein
MANAVAGPGRMIWPLSCFGGSAMKILAGSLNVEVGSFLHAGYTSASLWPAAQTYKQFGPTALASYKVKLIDVKKGVELKETQQPAVGTPADTAGLRAVLPATIVSDAFGLAIAFFFFAYVVSLYCRRVRKIANPRGIPWLLAAVPVTVFVAVHYWALPAYQVHALNCLTPPWEGVPIQQYKDPRAATEVIQNALIGNALLGVPRGVRTLAALQREVAFPATAAEHTRGMTYAEKTYGRDGWGREFRFEPLGDGRYRVTSAGPDGLFGTPDDIALVVRLEGGSWAMSVDGVYCRSAEGRECVLVHRAGGDFQDRFRAAHPDDAQRVTGTELFDLFSLQELLGGGRRMQDHEPPILAELKSWRTRAATNEGDSELLFARFEDKWN